MIINNVFFTNNDLNFSKNVNKSEDIKILPEEVCDNFKSNTPEHDKFEKQHEQNDEDLFDMLAMAYITETNILMESGMYLA